MIDPTQLSERESEVLKLAAEGLSDKEIATRLNLSPATVNSYWVRIRGKLGHLSRTEFVAQLLRQEASAELGKAADRFSKQIAKYDKVQDDYECGTMAPFYRAALYAIPDPLLVYNRHGIIEFANERLCTLIGCKLSEIIGKELRELFPKSLSVAQTGALLQALRSEETSTLGIRTVFYVKREHHKDGRVIVQINPATAPSGRIGVCLVRPFLDEVETRRERLQVVTQSHLQ